MKPESVGGGGPKGAELVNLPFHKKFWRSLRAKADCTVHILSSLERLFHSVIYNSVDNPPPLPFSLSPFLISYSMHSAIVSVESNSVQC